jgi:hypothetical protein
MQRVSGIPSRVESRIAQQPTTQSKSTYAPGFAGGLTRLVFVFLVLLCGGSTAQSALPFAVSNPKHKKWPADEATRIYFSACEMAARAIRPEQPPHLHPAFILVLGAQDDETVRSGNTLEVRLKSWRPDHFAEAVVVMAVREVLPDDQVAKVVRSALISSQASVSVGELEHRR